MPPLNTRNAKAWGRNEKNRSITNFEALDYDEMLTPKEEATDYGSKLWCPFLLKDKIAHIEESVLEIGIMKPYEGQDETFKDFTISHIY